MIFKLFAAVALAVTAAAAADDPYLTQLYDKLHDSPMQRKIRELAPMPFGVVFLPWSGMTEQQMREHFRLMKKLGFNNLKQTQETPEWPQAKVLEIALEEGIIPFWYGEGGWERVTPELLRKLGLPENATKQQIRTDPRMLAYQKEVIRKGIALDSGRPHLESTGFKFTPDPILRSEDVKFFQRWLRDNYKSPLEIAVAWNQYEVGIDAKPFQSWDDVDSGVAHIASLPNNLRGYGGEYGRVRDVLRFKAEYHTRDIQSLANAANKTNPNAPTRTGGEMGLFLPFAWRATKMEALANTQTQTGSFYPSIHFAWHFGEVGYEVPLPIYMQVSFAADLFKGGWTGAWESTGGPQQFTGAKGWDYEQGSTTPGFSATAGTITQLFLSYLAGGFKGAGVWTWNFRRAGWEGGEYALLDRNGKATERAIRAGQIAQAAEKLRDELWEARKEPQVGVLYNWDSDAIWAAMSLRGRDHFRHYPMQARVGISRALINGSIPWEHVTPADIEAGLAPRYKVIYLPAQIAVSNQLLEKLIEYVKNGGRVVLDAPGALYDEHGLVLNTAEGSAFERLFGVEISDSQYSSNVVRVLMNQKLDGFVFALTPTRAQVKLRFQTDEPAVTEVKLGKGAAVVLAWDASYAHFKPGKSNLEFQLRKYLMGDLKPPYSCLGAAVYRLAAPAADHYFFINESDTKSVRLDTGAFRYSSATDVLTGKPVDTTKPIPLERFSGRWLRLEKAPRQ
ncbi:MAG: beta-galactosidase trimerization domain-containing protein [Bryobacteraceae bacterium]|nr:beta-galactosidase trimerization domain-containing protein [Bryobacteraceae bacterium]